MTKIFARIALLALVVALGASAQNRSVAKGPNEDGTKPALIKIAGEGMLDSHAYQYLTELSDDVGARVTGSPQAQKAVEWGLAKMKAIGLENVHAEKWQLWRGWTRGTAEAEMLSPIRRPLHVDAMGWTGSTPAGGAEGDVVAVNLFDLDGEMKNMSRLTGKIPLIVMRGEPNKSFIQLFAQLGDFLRAAGKVGVIAVIGGQGGGKSAGNEPYSYRNSWVRRGLRGSRGFDDSRRSGPVGALSLARVGTARALQRAKYVYQRAG